MYSQKVFVLQQTFSRLLSMAYRKRSYFGSDNTASTFSARRERADPQPVSCLGFYIFLRFCFTSAYLLMSCSNHVLLSRAKPLFIPFTVYEIRRFPLGDNE